MKYIVISINGNFFRIEGEDGHFEIVQNINTSIQTNDMIVYQSNNWEKYNNLAD